MEMMIKKFCQRYRLPEKSLHELLSHMTEYHFGKGESIVKEGERNSNFYILKKGIWRAYYMIDGTESSLWFAGTGEIAFSSWGYVNNEVSQVNIESVNESIAYSIAKPDLEELFNSSIELSNFGRKIFEQEILFIDSYTLAYGTPSAKERYLTLMEENPELLQYVPLKHLASYLYITTIFEQNTGRAEEKEINHPNTSIPFSESMLHNLSAPYLLRIYSVPNLYL